MKNQILKGKVAIITGSSRGIGKAIAIELAEKGASIVLNGRNHSRLNDTENEIRKIQPELISVCSDVSTIQGGQYLIDEAIKKFGRIDMLVNNVGVSMRGKLADLNPEVYKTILDSNVLSVVFPSIPAIRHLRETKGSIIFISSLAGIRGLPGMSAYCSAKMALRALAESINRRSNNLCGLYRDRRGERNYFSEWNQNHLRTTKGRSTNKRICCKSGGKKYENF